MGRSLGNAAGGSLGGNVMGGSIGKATGRSFSGARAKGATATRMLEGGGEEEALDGHSRNHAANPAEMMSATRRSRRDIVVSRRSGPTPSRVTPVVFHLGGAISHLFRY